MTRSPLLLCLAGLVVAGMAGCGGDDDNGQPSREQRATAAAARAGVAADLRFFSASSPWNRRADGEPTERASVELLRRASQRVGVVERAGESVPDREMRTVRSGLFVNTRAWSPPIVSGGAVTRVRCRQKLCGDGESVSTLRIPADAHPDPRYDGWFTVISSDGRTAYDLWRARREKDRSISYSYLRRWDLRGPGAGEPSEVGARGSGLPLFAGAIRRHELDEGKIDHALAIAVPGPAQRRYVRPASATNGNGVAASLPEGARIRLKPGVRLTGTTVDERRLSRRQQRARETVLVALRQYGAIVVDRAAVPTLYAERDAASDVLRGDELAQLDLMDFEVVRLGAAVETSSAQVTEGTG